MTLVVAGTKYRGQFEERMKALVDELEKNRDVIVFIDEIHTLVGTGSTTGTLDAANILKPALARGDIQVIGATTQDEYRKYIEKDGALVRRFQPVIVDAPSIEDSIEIIKQIRGLYESHHKVTYTEEALKACVIYSDRYVTDRFLPDKAIDLLDEAGALVHIENMHVPESLVSLEEEMEKIKIHKLSLVQTQKYEAAAKYRDEEKKLLQDIDKAKEQYEKEMETHRYPVTEEHVAKVISMVTGIPIGKMSTESNKKALHLGDDLKNSVIGQDSAVTKVTKAVRRSKTGLKDPKKPIGTFMFVGPTGVGKTQLAKAVAKELFGTEDHLIRIDMSEYQEKFNVSRLIGAPPGYVGYEEGGQLTEKVKRKPYSVILLDEIEKAHHDVFNLLLQVLDDGVLTDSLGRKIDFKNTIIIMTSNVGARNVRDFGTGIGFATKTMMENQDKLIEESVQKELKKVFPPEFINRLDEIVMFNSLSKEHLHEIIDISLSGLSLRMEAQGFFLAVSDKAKDFLVEKGYDPQNGARPMNRAIQTYVEDIIAEEILLDTIVADDTILIDHNDGEDHLVLSKQK